MGWRKKEEEGKKELKDNIEIEIEIVEKVMRYDGRLGIKEG